MERALEEGRRELALANAIIQWTLPSGWCWYSARKFSERLGWSQATVERRTERVIQHRFYRRFQG